MNEISSATIGARLSYAKGQFYGWPYAYLTPNNLDPRQVQNGKSKRPDKAASTQTPDVLFRLIQLPWDSSFTIARHFQKKYRNGAFVAFRGSRDHGTGYKIVFVPFDANNRPQGYYEDFHRFPAQPS